MSNDDDDDDGYSDSNDMMVTMVTMMMVCIVEDGACTLMSTLSYWSLNKNVPSLYGVVSLLVQHTSRSLYLVITQSFFYILHTIYSVCTESQNGAAAPLWPQRVITAAVFLTAVFRELWRWFLNFCFLYYDGCEVINHYPACDNRNMNSFE